MGLGQREYLHKLAGKAAAALDFLAKAENQVVPNEDHRPGDRYVLRACSDDPASFDRGMARMNPRIVERVTPGHAFPRNHCRYGVIVRIQGIRIIGNRFDASASMSMFAPAKEAVTRNLGRFSGFTLDWAIGETAEAAREAYEAAALAGELGLRIKSTYRNRIGRKTTMPRMIH